MVMRPKTKILYQKLCVTSGCPIPVFHGLTATRTQYDARRLRKTVHIHLLTFYKGFRSVKVVLVVVIEDSQTEKKITCPNTNLECRSDKNQYYPKKLKSFRFLLDYTIFP